MGCHCAKSSASDGQDIRDTYKLGQVLGSGSFGQVRLCIKKGTNESYAVKIMSKVPPKNGPKIDHELMFKNEIEMLAAFKHPNVIKFHEFYEDKHFFYAVMEKCDGGELFAKIVKKCKFTEDDAALLTRQMLEAIAYIHSRNVVHRDIKAENFLFKTKEDASPLVLIDFGMSTTLTENQVLTQLCGSPHYVAPELIRRQYQYKVDMWALGVMIYLMLYGKYPFEGSDHKSIVQKILKTEPDYNRGHVRPSSLAMDFMKKLLAKNPDKRLSAEQALKHSWVAPENSPTNRQFVVDEDTIKNAQRKASFERETKADEVKEIEKIYAKRLSELEQEYDKGKGTGGRKLSGTADSFASNKPATSLEGVGLAAAAAVAAINVEEDEIKPNETPKLSKRSPSKRESRQAEQIKAQVPPPYPPPPKDRVLRDKAVSFQLAQQRSIEKESKKGDISPVSMPTPTAGPVEAEPPSATDELLSPRTKARKELNWALLAQAQAQNKQRQMQAEEAPLSPRTGMRNTRSPFAPTNTKDPRIGAIASPRRREMVPEEIKT